MNPATARQKSYGIHLEDELNIKISDWEHMTVNMARERIGALVKLKAAESGTQDWTKELYEATRETRRNSGRIYNGDTYRGHQ